MSGVTRVAGEVSEMPARPALLMPAVGCGEAYVIPGVAATTGTTGVVYWAKAVRETQRMKTGKSLRNMDHHPWDLLLCLLWITDE